MNLTMDDVFEVRAEGHRRQRAWIEGYEARGYEDRTGQPLHTVLWWTRLFRPHQVRKGPVLGHVEDKKWETMRAVDFCETCKTAQLVWHDPSW